MSQEVPKVFQDFFDESEILRGLSTPVESQHKTWGDQLREELLSLEPDNKIVEWEEVGEGAIAAVIATHVGVDPFLFTINGPRDIPVQIDLWTVDPFYQTHLPEVTAYRQWGNSNYTNKDNEGELKSFSCYIENGKEFLERLREMRWQEFLQP